LPTIVIWVSPAAIAVLPVSRVQVPDCACYTWA
jgi:hypothetical protein